MTFFYNEHACRTILDLHTKLLAPTRHNIDFLEREQSSATDPAVRMAYESELAKNRHVESIHLMKIQEMESLLSSLSPTNSEPAA